MTETQTAKPANASRNKNRAANQAAVAQISELYPETFNREAVKPLKIGIQEDLLADAKLSKGKIKRALASYVRSPLYYKSLVAGADRVDLAGEAAGKVTEQEAEHAKSMLKKAREQRQQRAQEQKKQAKQTRINDKLAQLVSKHS
ncbi:ProQ/FINO family protein [Motiliproteus sp.]|uniref:ProQ/FINO family protein n=1 Tax=Motiliproteus sp. TaxID=1898955 RepID=UPI003BA9037A